MDSGHVFAYPSKSPESSTRFLEPNHSTFLMVDNGLQSTSATGKESLLDANTFRHKLEVKKLMLLIKNIGYEVTPIIA